jgi:hypothetical protein
MTKLVNAVAKTAVDTLCLFVIGACIVAFLDYEEAKEKSQSAKPAVN